MVRSPGLVAHTGVPGGRVHRDGTVQVEFVAIDHAPFQPRVQAAVTFAVRR